LVGGVLVVSLAGFLVIGKWVLGSLESSARLELRTPGPHGVAMVFVRDLGKAGIRQYPVLQSLADESTVWLTNQEPASVSGFEWVSARRLRVLSPDGAKPEWPRRVDGVTIEWVVQ
jgi:hypothetical protein